MTATTVISKQELTDSFMADDNKLLKQLREIVTKKLEADFKPGGSVKIYYHIFPFVSDTTKARILPRFIRECRKQGWEIKEFSATSDEQPYLLFS